MYYKMTAYLCDDNGRQTLWEHMTKNKDEAEHLLRVWKHTEASVIHVVKGSRRAAYVRLIGGRWQLSTR